MTLSALIISIFIQLGYINNASDLNNIPQAQQQQWQQEIIDDETYGN